ncbi:MAG TPA: COQ9 family protein [Alphaproteobacteria bacterium]|nr:COQ9 family protein [Alphaproteobacteria bacterium]
MTQNDQDKILLALLKNVPFDGWSDEALRKTADGKKIKLSDLMLAFPAGIPDALAAFAAYGERQMLTKLSKHKLIQMRVRDRVKLGVQLWLEAMTPHREAVRAAIQSAWQPGRAFAGLKNMAKLCDAIWYEAGDHSTDFNYYTKRGLLALVLGSTVVYWLQDESDDFERTEEFLEARIENAMQAGKIAGSVKNLGSLFEKAKDLSAIAEILPKRKKAA